MPLTIKLIPIADGSILEVIEKGFNLTVIFKDYREWEYDFVFEDTVSYQRHDRSSGNDGFEMHEKVFEFDGEPELYNKYTFYTEYPDLPSLDIYAKDLKIYKRS